MTATDLFSRLLVVATPVVAATQAKIESTHGPSAHQIVAEGQQIYAKKPNMGQEDVTWSQREYGHLGLQKEYLRYKSVQRLTEAWACLQRARNAGVFASLREGLHDGDRQTLRWASLGGGPGFELLAVRWFFERHYPSYDLDLVSLDLEGSWRPCAEGLGLRFNEWDVNDGDGLERAAGGRVDFSIASYVLKMYMANEACAGWLGAKLNALRDPDARGAGGVEGREPGSGVPADAGARTGRRRTVDGSERGTGRQAARLCSRGVVWT